jgi:hypothetical protein
MKFPTYFKQIKSKLNEGITHVLGLIGIYPAPQNQHDPFHDIKSRASFLTVEMLPADMNF